MKRQIVYISKTFSCLFAGLGMLCLSMLGRIVFGSDCVYIELAFLFGLVVTDKFKVPSIVFFVLGLCRDLLMNGTLGLHSLIFLVAYLALPHNPATQSRSYVFILMRFSIVFVTFRLLCDFILMGYVADLPRIGILFGTITVTSAIMTKLISICFMKQRRHLMAGSDFI